MLSVNYSNINLEITRIQKLFHGTKNETMQVA